MRTLRALVEWYMHTAPHVAAPDAAVAPPHAEDGVQKDWNQLQSLPSGGPSEQPQRSSATGEAPGMPRKDSAVTSRWYPLSLRDASCVRSQPPHMLTCIAIEKGLYRAEWHLYCGGSDMSPATA